MQISFYLDKSNIDKNGEVSIYYSLTFSNSRIRKKVKGVKTHPSNWITKAQRIKTPLKSEPYNYYIEYNKIIDEVENNFRSLNRYVLLNNITPTKEFILEKLNNLETIKITHGFFESFYEFIETNKSTKVPRTIKSYRTTLNFLENFESETGTKITFDTIDQAFFEKLQDYTFLNRKNKNSYLAFIIKVLKTFLNWTYDREYHDNLKFKKFKAREDETEVIFLTLDELMKLFHFDFDSDRLNHVRDIYCFLAFCGLRISDASALKSSNIKEDHLTLTVLKTRASNTIIPLNKFTKEILNRYTDTIYEPLPIISDQKFNKYIKECCKIVGIDTPITTTRYVGQKRIDKTAPKYKFITSHTARKTFVTNSLILGMKEMVVRNITGHKKEGSFRRYVKIAEDFKKQEMDDTWNKL